jgi:hypothetical protein
METYPDSVRRVRPPNTTIPKTLAALARSQYATAFELVSGKREDCSMVLSACLIASVNLAVVLKDRREMVHGCCICCRARLKSFRNARLLLIEWSDGRKMVLEGLAWHEKNRFDRFGAASCRALRKAEPANIIDSATVHWEDGAQVWWFDVITSVTQVQLDELAVSFYADRLQERTNSKITRLRWCSDFAHDPSHVNAWATFPLFEQIRWTSTFVLLWIASHMSHVEEAMSMNEYDLGTSA